MPLFCTITGSAFYADGTLGDENIYITADNVTLNGAVIATAPETFYPEPVGGIITLILPRGSTARLYGNVRGFHDAIVVAIPDTPTADLEDLIPVILPGALPQGLSTTSSPEFAGLTIGGLPVGYLGIPQNSQSAAYVTVLADAGKHIIHPTADNNARTFTIASNANVAYAIGTAITFINLINAVTIAIASDTLILAGAGTTGSRTLAANGVATAIKITTTSWIISGAGLS